MSSQPPGNASWLAAALTAARRLITPPRGVTRRAKSPPRRRQFRDRGQPGVFTVASPRMAAALGQRALADGLVVARINGQGVTTKAGFLAAAARDLAFPAYFGHNWDAFADCLGDFAANPGHGTVLILGHLETFASAAPREWRTALTILDRAVMERARTARPLFVLIQGPGEMAPGIPAFDGAGGHAPDPDAVPRV